MPGPDTSPTPSAAADRPARVHRLTVTALLVILAVELAATILEGQWLNVFLILTIMAVTIAPVVLRRRLAVDIPAEFQLLAIVFVFAALFLGEIQSYYERFWWWDLALHATSGLLLGLLGFLLVYVLNQSERVALQMRPSFVALFAVLFAVAVGAFWEVFEFSMDQVFGTSMQKSMRTDATGLTDTMWDLIVDIVGAVAVGVFGWLYLRREVPSFVETWVQRFIERNPHLFRN